MNNAIVVQNVSKKFKNSQDKSKDFFALKDINIVIPEKQCTVIAGSNGSGKTMLMSLIAKLEKPSCGKITCSGRVGIIFQETETQILGETPYEDIAISLYNKKLSSIEKDELITTILSTTNLLDKKDFPARSLSGGEKRRLAVASMLALDFPIIIFDEPYANLDYPGILALNALLRNLKKAEKTILLLTHELEKGLALADNFIVLHKGEVCLNVTPEEALKRDLTAFGIKNPLVQYNNLSDLEWK